MLSTGCMFFSNQWVQYAKKLGRISAAHDESARLEMVYILANEDGDMDPHMLRGKIVTPLFEHGGASSWHGWDAAAIVLIGKHYGYFAALLFISVAASSLAIRRLAVRLSGRRRMRSPFLRPRGSMDKREDEERLLVAKDG
jgi:inositol phosphorylceramide mannosyltransferase catalytic subunit